MKYLVISILLKAWSEQPCRGRGCGVKPKTFIHHIIHIIISSSIYYIALVTHLPVFLTLFPKINFTNEKATGAIDQSAIGANKSARNFLLFHVLLFQ